MSTTVKACFTVECVTDYGETQKNIRLRASLSDGNTDWSKYTPSGTLEMMITNPPAAAFFVPGKTVYLTFAENPHA